MRRDKKKKYIFFFWGGGDLANCLFIVKSVLLKTNIFFISSPVKGTEVVIISEAHYWFTDHHYIFIISLEDIKHGN